jgi:rod shape-determining protein MreD
MSAQSHRLFFIGLTLLGALTLSIVPLPSWGESLRPQWVVLVLIYWCLVQPARAGVFTGFAFGLAQDVVSGTLLGAHAFSLSVVAFLAEELHRRIRAFPLWQQSLVVWLLLLVERLLSLWVHGAIGQPTPALAYWVPTFVGMLLWPWLSPLLDRWRASAGVA